MFTGIVQMLGSVHSVVEREGGVVRLELALGEFADGLVGGASVAVNGTCLTATHIQDNGVVAFDVIPQTLRLTNLAHLNAGDQVNVERSFRVGDEIGGHIVSGHVSGTADILERNANGGDVVVRFRADPTWSKYIFDKGFVAIDGASLTISAMDRSAGWFEVSLIPETLSRTTLGFKETGDQVNVEVEASSAATVETVERILQDPVWRNKL